MKEQQIRRARLILDIIEELQKLKEEIVNGAYLPTDATDEQVVEYLTKIIQHGYPYVLHRISRDVEAEIDIQIRENEEILKNL